MGGVDKGLQPHRGQPLALHALQRLRPQVGPLMLSANRHLDTYRAFGVPVWPDAWADHPGPLAGMLAGLERCATPWLAAVPCDTPSFPSDLVARLAAALVDEEAEIALAATSDGGRLQLHPVCSLMAVHLADSARAALAGGERRIGHWASRHRRAVVVFDDVAAFFNANTVDELQQLQRDGT